MRSVYFKILLWCFGTLLLSLAAFVMVSIFISGSALRAFFTDVHAFHTAEAVRSYESGGTPGLAAYLGTLHSFLKEHDYLTDAQGKDLVTGEDRSSLLKLARPATEQPQRSNGRFVMITPSIDTRYRLIS